MGPRIREHGTAVHDNTQHSQPYVNNFLLASTLYDSADLTVDASASVALAGATLSALAGAQFRIAPFGGINIRPGTNAEPVVLLVWWDVGGTRRSAQYPVVVPPAGEIFKVNFDEADVNGTMTQNVKNLAPGLAVGVELVVEAEVSIIGLNNQEFQVQFLLKSNTGATLDSFFLHAAATGAGDVFELSGKLKGSITTTVANEQFFVAVAVVLGGATWTVHSHRIYRVMGSRKRPFFMAIPSESIFHVVFWNAKKTTDQAITLMGQLLAGSVGNVIVSDRYLSVFLIADDLP